MLIDTGYELVKDALKIYPHAASISDNHGNLPLHTGLYSGKTWNSGIKEIFEAAPDSNLVQDHKTRLFPFMIAASRYNNDSRNQYDNYVLNGHHKKESRLRKEGSISELTTIFQLLRNAPFQVNNIF